MTSIISLDSICASWLRSMSVPHVLPPQLWKTSHDRAWWLHHLTVRTLSQKQTGRDTRLVQRSQPQHLTALHVQVLGHVPRDWRTLNLAKSERNPSIQKDSVPLQLKWIKIFDCLVRRAKALCHAIMVLRTNHTLEKSLAQQTEQGPDLGHQRLRMFYELSAWRPLSWALS
jgi:hypothetical protein